LHLQLFRQPWGVQPYDGFRAPAGRHAAPGGNCSGSTGSRTGI